MHLFRINEGILETLTIKKGRKIKKIIINWFSLYLFTDKHMEGLYQFFIQ